MRLEMVGRRRVAFAEAASFWAGVHGDAWQEDRARRPTQRLTTQPSRLVASAFAKQSAFACCLQPPRPLQQAPVDTFQQVTQLRRRDRH